MVKASQLSIYISAGDLRKNDVIEFLDEGEIVEDSFNKGKMKIQVKVRLNDGEEKLFCPNATTRNHLKKSWGDDLAGWIGKKATVDFMKKEVMGEIKEVAFLEPIAWDE